MRFIKALRSVFLVLLVPTTLGAQLIIPESERAALIALFKSTGGPNWRNHGGWLGGRGTECEWYGIWCDNENVGPSEVRDTVRSIDLDVNNLSGSLPDELCALTGLRRLDVSNNPLSDKVPDCLYRKPGPLLIIIAEGTGLDVIKKFSLETQQTGLLCSHRGITFTDDGLAILETEHCRSPQADRRSYCETRFGHLGLWDFSTAAALIESSGFEQLESKYYAHATHQEDLWLTVTKAGTTKRVEDYGHAGPVPLQELELAVSGLEPRVGRWTPGWDVIETGPCEWSPEPVKPAWFSPNAKERNGSGLYKDPNHGFEVSVPKPLTWSDFSGVDELVSRGAFVHIEEVKNPVWADRNMSYWVDFSTLRSPADDRCTGPYAESFINPDDKTSKIHRATTKKKIFVGGLVADSCHTVFESKAWGDAVIEDVVVVERADDRILDPAERALTALRYRFSLETIGSTYSQDRKLFEEALKTVRFSRPGLWRAE